MKRHNIDMLNGPLWSKILLFALPLMASSVMQLLFNAADVIVVGRFAGDASLAAVTSTGSLVNLLVNLFMGLSIGTNVIAAHALGRQDDGALGKTVHTAILVSFIGGVILSVLGVFLSPILLEVMDSPENVIGLSSLYLRIYFLGMPAMLAYNFGSSILRAQGDTRRPMVYLAIAGVVNVILNLILVIVFRLDVAGVAIATVVSQYISCFLVLRCLTRESGALHLDLKALRIDPGTLKSIALIGLPAGLQGMVFSLSNMVIQSSINSFGDVVMAGSGAAANIEGFVYVSMNALYQTCLTFSGQNYGAGKPQRVDRVILICVGFVTIAGVVCGGLAYAFAAPLLHIYSPSDEVVTQGIIRMTYVCLPYFLCGVMDTLVGALRGLGASVVPMCVSVVGVCGVRLMWIFTVFQAVHTPECLYISYPISWAATALIHLCCLMVVRKRSYKKIATTAAA